MAKDPKGTNMAVGASGSTLPERVVLYVVLGVAAAVFLLPFIWLISSSFKFQEQIFTHPPQVIPYVKVVDDAGGMTEVRVDETFTEPVLWAQDAGEGEPGVVKPGSPQAAGARRIEASTSAPWMAVTTIERAEDGSVLSVGETRLIQGGELKRNYELHWANFATIFSDAKLPRAFFNTTLIAVLHVALTLFLCSLAGTAFAKYKRAPGNGGLFTFVLGTMMIPGAVTSIPIFVVLAKANLINTYWAMIIPAAANAFGIFWMRQYVSGNVPDDLYDAARIDGCTEFSVYWRIVVPIAKPAMAALGVLVLINTWNNLMWAFIVMRTDNMYTMPLLVYLLQGEYQTPYGLIMAAGLVTTAPLIIAFLFFQRAFISGITAGAVKS